MSTAYLDHMCNDCGGAHYVALSSMMGAQGGSTIGEIASAAESDSYDVPRHTHSQDSPSCDCDEYHS